MQIAGVPSVLPGLLHTAALQSNSGLLLMVPGGFLDGQHLTQVGLAAMAGFSPAVPGSARRTSFHRLLQIEEDLVDFLFERGGVLGAFLAQGVAQVLHQIDQLLPVLFRGRVEGFPGTLQGVLHLPG